VFKDFDYTALGHIHGAQNIGNEKVRYCGTPLKYSLSECGQQKSVTVIELKEKNNLTVKTYPLKPLRDMRKIKGSYNELMSAEFYSQFSQEDYIGATLTDEEDIPNVMDKMYTVYKNLLDVRYDNKRTQSMTEIEETAQAEDKSPRELFEQLFEQQNNSQMSKEQSDYILSKIETIWGEQK
jgi:exonuclease SbcD